MQSQALVNQVAPSEPHSPFAVWRRASRWHEGVVRPEGAVRCKGSGHGQPWAGSPSSLGCMVATEVVTGTRSPPTSPAGVVHPGVEPGTAAPSGWIQSIRDMQAALETTSLGELPGRPVVPISVGGQPYQYSPPRGSDKNPGADCQKTHTLSCRSETSQFKTRMSPTSRQSHHDLLRSALLNEEEAARAMHPRGLEGHSGQHSSPGP